MFGDIIEQEPIVRILKIFENNDNIPNALLFSGIEGVGKRRCAELFASVCNCAYKDKTEQSEYPCKCRSCKKIRFGNHPDIILIEPEDSAIRISEIRKLCETFALKPLEAHIRFAIIAESDKMNEEAANALLKILEEPPERTSLILTASYPSKLLLTIISRCRHIRFSPISEKGIDKFLIEKCDTSSDVAATIAPMAQGSLAKAKKMKEEDWTKYRKWLLEEFESLEKKPIASMLSLAEKISADKETLATSLEIIKSRIRDILIYKVSPDKIINKDMIEKIDLISKDANIEKEYANIRSVESVEKGLWRGINNRLAVENMLFRIRANT